MTSHIKQEYMRQRKLGNNANQALRSARIRDKFEDLQIIGKVALLIKPDDSPDLSYLDQRDCFTAAIAKHEYNRANNDGVWGVIGQYRCPHCQQWQIADSVWGFIGDDWKDSGYDIDIMASTIAQYKQSLE